MQVITASFAKKQALTEAEKQNWHFKDVYADSIPGISLHKAYDFLKNKKGDTIIVAVIDLEINIKHKDLKNQIWRNKDEIPNNNIDDDNNGYIDDVHGWNFLGTNESSPILHHNSESTRIKRKYKEFFESKDLSNLNVEERRISKLYRRAIEHFDSKKSEAERNIVFFERFKDRYVKLIDTMDILFKTKKFDNKLLDSLNNITKDSIIKTKIAKTKYCIENGIDEKWINNTIRLHKSKISKDFNIDYNDRLTKDDPYDITDNIYGNNNVIGTFKMSHGTKVAGIIAAIRDNGYGINGVSKNAKIMPVVVATNGNEYDKDIALGIRYAVDNGAKIINMSIGKEFSQNPKWIVDAIKYAEINNVLIISSAGNESYDLDNKDNFHYPNDMDGERNEISNNFITVGSSNYSKELVSDYSNYGKKTIDIFAPGEDLKVITRTGTVKDSGTSISSAVVSGVASLVLSYYPDLTAKEVKQIILNSGILVDFNIFLPYGEGQERNENKVPFSSLSKSGKIVNAYNALLMAEEVSKKKKKRN